jgi:hypothetical protein
MLNFKFLINSSLFAALCTGIIFFPSCKTSYSFNGASVPADAKTLAIQYFKNQATLASPTLSASFTEALKDIFSSQTKLRQVEREGDLNFEGTIIGYSTSPLAIQSNDQAALNRLTITVNVKYTNRFDEKKNFETSFSRFADYQSSLSLASVESDLIKEINKQLTEDIFNRALNDW